MCSRPAQNSTGPLCFSFHKKYDKIMRSLIFDYIHVYSTILHFMLWGQPWYSNPLLHDGTQIYSVPWVPLNLALHLFRRLYLTAADPSKNLRWISPRFHCQSFLLVSIHGIMYLMHMHVYIYACTCMYHMAWNICIWWIR